MFRSSLAAVAASVALLGASTVPAGAQPARPASAVAAKSCSSGFTKARIGGQTKCLRRGEYCAVHYKRTYRSYGYTCSGSPARLH